MFWGLVPPIFRCGELRGREGAPDWRLKGGAHWRQVWVIPRTTSSAPARVHQLLCLLFLPRFVSTSNHRGGLRHHPCLSVMLLVTVLRVFVCVSVYMISADIPPPLPALPLSPFPIFHLAPPTATPTPALCRFHPRPHSHPHAFPSPHSLRCSFNVMRLVGYTNSKQSADNGGMDALLALADINLIDYKGDRWCGVTVEGGVCILVCFRGAAYLVEGWFVFHDCAKNEIGFDFWLLRIASRAFASVNVCCFIFCCVCCTRVRVFGFGWFIPVWLGSVWFGSV